MKPESQPFFSVIIPSYNRLEEIRELIISLNNQTFPKNQFEVLIIDDGSTDGTGEWILTSGYQNSLPLTVYIQNHQGPGAARNMGMQKAAGQYFIFIDSDCTAPSDWLERMHTRLIREPDIRGFGGRDDALSHFPALLLAINYSMTSFLTTGGMRGGRKKRLAKFYPRSFNMGIHRDLYRKIGGFGSLRHGQDIEFSHRMIASGEKIVYIADSVVYHKRRTSLLRFYRQVFNWGVARVNLYKIDAKMLEPLHAAPAIGFWGAILFTLAADLFPDLHTLWAGLAVLVLLLLLVSGFHAAIRWKNPRAGCLTPLVMVLQVSGYALGFTAAMIWRVVLGREEWTGFVKQYYQ